MNVQKNTVVEQLWRQGEYRPPWIWSLIDVLVTSRRWLDGQPKNIDTPYGTPGNPVLVSSPSGGGRGRGVHNCGKCDKELLNAVADFSIDQNVEKLALASKNKCDCKKVWEAEKVIGKRLGTPLDLGRSMG